MDCPNCQLVNPPGAELCDCGYSFTNGSIVAHSAPLRSAMVLASRPERWLAQFFDLLITGLPFVAAVLLYGVWPDGGAVLYIFAPAVATAYLLFSDGLKGGQSYGKRALDISVVDEATGRACTFTASVKRNLPLMLIGPIDAVFVFGSKRQRLGDKLASTLVVKGKAAV